ncbi:MAG: hypothetical protein H2056_00220 [Sphingopyxis sp.]|nr:hypothetical protein [Sphingopyxis sp.]
MMKSLGMIAAVTLFGCAAPTMAQDKILEDPKVKDVGNTVTEPFDGKEIPAKLAAIQDNPYALTDMDQCTAIAQEIRELDAVLGPDANEIVEKSRAEKREATAGRLVGSAGKSLIPFSGIVGEVSGANAERRRYAIAVQAGTARRGFLKGVGLSRGCKAPARP